MADMFIFMYNKLTVVDLLVTLIMLGLCELCIFLVQTFFLMLQNRQISFDGQLLISSLLATTVSLHYNVLLHYNVFICWVFWPDDLLLPFWSLLKLCCRSWSILLLVFNIDHMPVLGTGLLVTVA
ncbi:hypothetical protein DsansV1_C13g0122271 [Dioscorea sansibarensis]